MAEVRVQLPLGALQQTGRLHRMALLSRVCSELDVRAEWVKRLRVLL
jgi:hypothetical protein